MAPIAVGNAYLHSRGFTDELVVRFQVRATEDSVIFPVVDDGGNVVGAIVRYFFGPIRYRSFGSKAFPWGLAVRLDPSRPVWVTEGPFGAIVPISLGYQAVAVAGAAVNKHLVSFLSGFDLRVVFDDDAAGYLGAKRLVERAPRVRVAVPGLEADEVGPDVWEFIHRAPLLRATPSFLKRMAEAKMNHRD
jgi:DNA primase